MFNVLNTLTSCRKIQIVLIIIAIKVCSCASRIWERGKNEVAEFEKYKFIASILRSSHGVCTGTLITRQYVLTSAVCSFGSYHPITRVPVPEDKSLFELRLKSDRVDSGGGLQTIVHIYINPKFKAVDLQTEHDESIFKIVWILDLGRSLSLAWVNILTEQKLNPLLNSNTVCESIGWGYGQTSHNGQTTKQEEMRRVEVMITTWDNCDDLNVTGKDDLCGFLPTKSCFLTRGSGSPLICDDQVVAMASWGARCGVDQQQLVFTRLDHWVEPFVRTRDASRRSDYSVSTRLEPSKLFSLGVLVAYPICLSIARRFDILSKYIEF